MISFDEAIELIRSVAAPVGVDTLPIEAAVRRVLAAPVVARIDSPLTDVSTMDGYAVRDDDLQALPVSLRVVGQSFPGRRWAGAVERGSCVRIFTGAAVPEGADRVVIQEIVQRAGDQAAVAEDPGAARFIRQHAADFAAGDEMLPVGTLLDPRGLVAAAAADVAEVEVYRRPRVTVLSTGDELVEPGAAHQRADAVPDSVSPGVASLSEAWGAECIARERLPDDLSRMEAAAAAAFEQSDLVVVTGGASVGERDFAKAMFERSGLELIFSKLAIKPGKPAWLGSAGGRLVIGLPGNPTSAMVTARLLLAPLLTGMTGRSVERALAWRSAPLGASLPACGDRETFHRAQQVGPAAIPLSFQDSGAQKALAMADLLVRQRIGAPAKPAGDLVDVLDF
jgi:molybdopterin molybdotransferase